IGTRAALDAENRLSLLQPLGPEMEVPRREDAEPSSARRHQHGDGKVGLLSVVVIDHRFTRSSSDRFSVHATSAASSGVRAVMTAAPGTIRLASLESTSPGPASTNVVTPASARARIDRSH